jgi:hypothetical protein
MMGIQITETHERNGMMGIDGNLKIRSRDEMSCASTLPLSGCKKIIQQHFSK